VGSSCTVDGARGFAAEFRPRKIRVNAIAPSGVETEGTHSAGIIAGDFEKAMIAGTPLGRIGHPTTSRASPFSCPPMILRGSPASGSRRRAATDDAVRSRLHQSWSRGAVRAALALRRQIDRRPTPYP
jgi:NAD(P)-dependent dehydrogenase (short-subunit alcohol dehydrogenase family)